MTRAGIHADGLLKDEEIYNIFNTKKLLGRPPIVAIDAFSGLAGIAFWINNFYRLDDEYKIDKKTPAVALIKQKIDAIYAAGRNTCMSDVELEEMLRESDKALYEKFIECVNEKKKFKR
jgi:isopropylmalate/homocitrate/citramalate synthase